MTEKTQVKSQNFSQPWKFSDVVLIVEEERLHVHRAVLAMSSPVFEKMLTSEFPDKNEIEIPLLGKSLTEVKELLLMIYPSESDKQITEETCHFLVKLAHAYQMDAIVKRCEDFLVEKLKTKPKDCVLGELIFAQMYKLEKLRLAGVGRACDLTLDELKQDKMYDQIQSENLKEIIEGIIKRLEKELKESLHLNEENDKKITDVKDHIDCALRDVDKIASLLVDHVAREHGNTRRYSEKIYCKSTDVYIGVLLMDKQVEHYCMECDHPIICSSLSRAAADLKLLMEAFESMKAPLTVVN